MTLYMYDKLPIAGPVSIFTSMEIRLSIYLSSALNFDYFSIYYSPKIFWNWFNIQMPKHVNRGSLPPDINVLHSYQWYTNTIIDIATLTDHVKTLHTKISNIFALVFIFWKTWHFLFCRLKRASHTVIASQWKIHLKWSALQFLNFSIPVSTHKETSVVTLCLASLPSDSTLYTSHFVCFLHIYTCTANSQQFAPHLSLFTDADFILLPQSYWINIRMFV